MADFLIGDVKQVRELDQDDIVNAHLADGWVLLLVRAGTDMGHNPVSGEFETYGVTAYVIGWTEIDAPKSESAYKDQLAATRDLVDAANF